MVGCTERKFYRTLGFAEIVCFYAGYNRAGVWQGLRVVLLIGIYLANLSG